MSRTHAKGYWKGWTIEQPPGDTDPSEGRFDLVPWRQKALELIAVLLTAI